jgi:hypothetical protein
MTRVFLGTFLTIEVFQCLGTTLTKRNSIQEEFKNRFNSRNVLLSFGTNLLSFNLL